MTVQGNAYTVEQIDRAVARASSVVTRLPEGAVNAALIDTLIELYLGAIDADKDDKAKAASA